MLKTAMTLGRIVGLLTLLQIIGGVVTNFVLVGPVFAEEPGYLVNAAASPLRVGLAALSGIATALLTVAIAVLAFPFFRQFSERMALAFLALAVAGFPVNALENVGVMSMLSLSEAYLRAGAPAGELFDTLRLVVAATRNWAHYVGLIIAGFTLLVFYAVLLRFALVPRALAGFGLFAVLLQLTAVCMPLLGRDMILPLIAPLALSQLALAVWLLARDFRAPAT